MKDLVLEKIRDIRLEIGATERYPEINRVIKRDDKLIIECEDRADKSIVIGTGGWVVGKLAKELDVKAVTVESRLDKIIEIKNLMNSLHSLVSIYDDDFVNFAKSVILDMPPYGIKALVVGEELAWMCGFLEDKKSIPTLLHTGHIHKKIINRYGGTIFKKINIDSDDYELRLKKLMSHALNICEEKNIRIVFGPFEDSIFEDRGITWVNPQLFFWMTSWKTKLYEKKRFKSPIFLATQENKAYLIKNTIDNVYKGLMEPNEAARTVFKHWPEKDFKIEFDMDRPDDFLIRYRIKNALKRANVIAPKIYLALKNYLDNDQNELDLHALVAWSGGIDSTGAGIIARDMGINVKTATVIFPHMDRDGLRSLSDELNFRSIFLEPPHEYEEIISKTLQGNIHPCGQCSTLIENTLFEHAKETGYDTLIFGDMLSTGAQSMAVQDGLTIFNLPAALALTKDELEKIYVSNAMRTFGCPLLVASHNKKTQSKIVSLQRVFRELRAQALSREYAKDLILDIMKIDCRI